MLPGPNRRFYRKGPTQFEGSDKAGVERLSIKSEGLLCFFGPLCGRPHPDPPPQKGGRENVSSLSVLISLPRKRGKSPGSVGGIERWWRLPVLAAVPACVLRDAPLGLLSMRIGL